MMDAKKMTNEELINTIENADYWEDVEDVRKELFERCGEEGKKIVKRYAGLDEYAVYAAADALGIMCGIIDLNYKADEV